MKLLRQQSTYNNIKIFPQIKYGILFIFIRFLYRRNQYDRYAFGNVLGTWGGVAGFTEEAMSGIAMASPYI